MLDTIQNSSVPLRCRVKTTTLRVTQAGKAKLRTHSHRTLTGRRWASQGSLSTNGSVVVWPWAENFLHLFRTAVGGTARSVVNAGLFGGKREFAKA
jgi:hypothetical protein